MQTQEQMIYQEAQLFVKRWQGAGDEKSESQVFWTEFFKIFNLDLHTMGRLEQRVKAETSTKFIDVFVPGKLLCEQKSRGKNLDDAEKQAREYLALIQKTDPIHLPPYFVVCDFERFRFFEPLKNISVEFLLKDLPKNLGLFNFLIGLELEIRQKQAEANIEAARQMRELFLCMKEDHDADLVRKLLIRLLFLLFAEDTHIFKANQFVHLIENYTLGDGSNTGATLNTLFTVLNTDYSKRAKRMPEYLKDFSYINGGLFEDKLDDVYFNEPMRQQLIDVAKTIDWGVISPEIFGSLFQEAMDESARREMGAHYTDKTNIDKVLKSLFLNDLEGEFAQILKKSKTEQQKALVAFQQKISQLTFLDPACGTGNFLVAAYAALRRLEIRVIKEFNALMKQQKLLPSGVTINSFYGIELDPFAAEIARLSMWLIDHLMTQEEGVELGRTYGSLNIPLRKSAHIQNANALEIAWQDCDFILGNPPFVGTAYQTAQQKADTQRVCADIKLAGSLDYVANWYVKAAKMLKTSPETRVAFVSTNSITQGEQVSILFNHLFSQGVHIHFAHRTFQWTSEARGKAAVHCVIIGFGRTNLPKKFLFDGENVREVSNINGYLVEGESVAIERASKQISGEIEMTKGSQPTDGGHLLMDEAEKDALLAAEPAAAKFVRPFLGAEEFLNGKTRFCLWFADVDASTLSRDLKKMPKVNERIEAVKAMRLASSAKATRSWADKAHLFQSDRQPESGNYLIIPRVSSERRDFVPIDYVSAHVICGDANFSLPNATLYHFAMLSSTMHNAWMRTVAGRLKSDYRYSNTIVYNNFPFPLTRAERENATGDVKKAIANIEKLAQNILDIRAKYRQSDEPPSLAALYNPPATAVDPYLDLRQAHAKLDKAIDALYRPEPFANEAERVRFLFARYQSLMLEKPKKPTKKQAAK